MISRNTGNGQNGKQSLWKNSLIGSGEFATHWFKGAIKRGGIL